MPGLADSAVTGLSTALVDDGSVLRVWPAQLSEDGFRHALHRYVKLPQNDQTAGAPSRWCIVTGRIAPGGKRLMLGLVAQADRQNSLGLVAVESEQHWYDVLRLDDSS